MVDIVKSETLQNLLFLIALLFLTKLNKIDQVLKFYFI